MSNPALTELLASYVPRLIQNRVLSDPAPIHAPVSEEFQAAVLFADISGFTRLTEGLVERGPAGVENLARILNEYFGQLIDIVHEYGGDVVKFAGDAVIAVWNIVSDSEEANSVSRADQWQWTMRATECALAIRQRLSNYKVEDSNLYLKLAISSGQITAVHVGGEYNRWEFLLTGNPLVELGIANNLAKAGDIILTPSAWRLIRNDCIAAPIEFELKIAIAQGGRLKELDKPSSIFASSAKIEIPEDAENSLRAYIPGAIINRLTAGQGSWIAELRKVTILFINMPGIDQSTALAEAQALTQLIQKSVYRYEGSINKINVDDKGITVIAVLGLPPFSHENDPARGVQAALTIRKALQGRTVKVKSNIGVTTGRIFCGSIGNEKRREYTIIGNAVNLSARLMTAASAKYPIVEKYGVSILCDRLTYEGAKDVVEFESLPPQQVKGRSEAVEVFHPLDFKKSVIRPTTDLIGRQEEKTVIANALQELSRGVPHHTIILQGEAGIGKTRLFEDLVRQAETLRVHMHNGTGDPIEKSSSYHAWRPIFNRIFNIDELLAEADALNRSRLVAKQVTEKLTAIDPDLVRYIPLLDAILQIDIDDNELTLAMKGEIRASNTREVLTSVLAYETKQAPLLIVMEDLHWFDSASWDLLVDVQQKVRPIMLAVNTRPLPEPAPEQFKQLVEAPDTQFIKLEAMMLDDVESLVCQRLGVKSVPPLIGRLIREKSEGNPFFAEELAYALRDSGILYIENQECRLNSRFMNLEDLTLPDTLQAAITNRIDSLNPAQQLTLKVASVIGRIFAYRVLEAVHPIESDRRSLPDYLDGLTRLSLTLVDPEAPDLAYIFKHAVTQEVAYNLMLYSQRRQLHQSIAEWIEKNNEGNLESYYPLLAHHWTQATNITDSTGHDTAVRKALEYLEKAGERARETYANKEAIQFFSQALEWDAKILAAEGKQTARQKEYRRARWHGRIGLAHYALGNLPECDKNVREALRLLRKPIPSSNLQFVFGLLPQVIRQISHRFFPGWHIGRLRGEERDVALEVARLYELMSRIYFYSNQTIPIVYTVLRFLNEAEKAGTSAELATAYASMGVLAGLVQLHPLADSYVERGLSIAKEVNQPSNVITVNVVTSAYKLTVGKWEDVREKALEAKAISEELGDYRQWGDSVVLAGESALISGDMADAMKLQLILLEDARRRRNPLQQGWGLFGVAANNIRMGNASSAIPMLEEALQILEEIPNIASSINTHGTIALAHLRLRQNNQALHHADKVLKLAENLSPTVYSLNLGFSAVADVYFQLWENALQDSHLNLDAEQLKASALKAIKLVRAFEKVFPIGQPHTPYYEGWYEWLAGDKQKAVKLWSKSLEAAQKFKMLYEEGLVRTKLGMVEVSPDIRSEHLKRAIEIFTEMNAPHELSAARELQR
jgi:class 3 adenylate cyclase/tetratricopeptide (TPR) repeat protein